MSALISAVINVKNNASELKRCLKSLTFVDEIIVVDMDSEDESVSVAQQFGAKVFTHPDVGYADPARNFAISKASHDWIFVIDADEEVPATLADSLKSTVTNPVADVYWLPRINILFGRWAHYGGWWPDYQPRLFRKGFVTWHVGVHRLPTSTGTENHFPATREAALLHHNYASVNQFLTKLNRYTTIQAKERTATQKPTIEAPTLINQFKAEFFRRLFHDQGLQGGVHGVGLSLLQSCYELVIGMKQWENSHAPTHTTHIQATTASPTEVEKTLQALGELSSELRYWLADTRVKQSSGLKKIYWQIRRRLRI